MILTGLIYEKPKQYTCQAFALYLRAKNNIQINSLINNMVVLDLKPGISASFKLFNCNSNLVFLELIARLKDNQRLFPIIYKQSLEHSKEAALSLLPRKCLVEFSFGALLEFLPKRTTAENFIKDIFHFVIGCCCPSLLA